eukprot:13882153-Ditylum_brightwellii.AAC.1
MDWDWETAWVKGHQDKAIRHEELKWEEKLNVQADKLATMARSEINYKDHRERFDILPACHNQLFIDDKPITRGLKATIRGKWSEVELRKGYGWKSTDFDLIKWSESGQIFCNADFYHQQFITRYVYERLPVKGEFFWHALIQSAHAAKRHKRP